MNGDRREESGLSEVLGPDAAFPRPLSAAFRGLLLPTALPPLRWIGLFEALLQVSSRIRPDAPTPTDCSSTSADERLKCSRGRFTPG